MNPQVPPTSMPSPLSSATLGKVRRMLVARLTPDVLNPFDRTPERERLVRTTIAAILDDPELELAPGAGARRRGRGGGLWPRTAPGARRGH